MTSGDAVRLEAERYLFWTALTALTGYVAFVMDGLYIGATWTVTMRNMMVASTLAYLLSWWGAVALLGNDGLWLSLNIWLLVRGLSLWGFVPRETARTFGAR